MAADRGHEARTTHPPGRSHADPDPIRRAKSAVDNSSSISTTFAALRPFWIGGDKYGYLYDVLLDGKVIVRRSHDPEHDACRALLAKGITGKLTLTDLEGTPRSSIDIETGAKWRVIDDDKRGLLMVPYRAWPGTSTGPSPQTRKTNGGSEGPDEANAAVGEAPLHRKAGKEVSVRETGDEYPHVVLRLGNDWRIVGCRDDMQWIFQRRAGSAWRSLGYSRNKIGLTNMLQRNSLDPSAVDGFPDMYPEGKRITSLQPSARDLKRATRTRRETEKA